MTTKVKKAPSGLKLKPVDVTVSMLGGKRHGRRSLRAIFRDLERAGIDMGRPFWLHMDPATREATARQDPWEAS